MPPRPILSTMRYLPTVFPTIAAAKNSTVKCGHDAKTVAGGWWLVAGHVPGRGTCDRERVLRRTEGATRAGHGEARSRCDVDPVERASAGLLARHRLRIPSGQQPLLPDGAHAG